MEFIEFIIENGKELLIMLSEAVSMVFIWFRTKKTDLKKEIEKSETKTNKYLELAKKQAEKTEKMKEKKE